MFESPKNKKVMVFGAFDVFHEGHRYFLEKALEEGSELIIALTPDEIIHEIKGRFPKHNFEERKQMLEKEKVASEVISGDKKLASWEVLKKHKPDIIALGYDQKKLEKSLRNELENFDFKPKLVIIPPFKPEKYHSRFFKEPRDTIKISGQIQSGRGEANVLGFPTINLSLEKEYPSGIYAGRVHLHGVDYKAAIYIRPEKDIIEAHILDFHTEEKLYGEWTVIEIGNKIREVIRTKSLQDLKELISSDIRKVRKISY